MVRAMQVDGRWVLAGGDVGDANEFLMSLFAAGRSSYTLRSYALGLASFLRWVGEGDRRLVGVIGG